MEKRAVAPLVLGAAGLALVVAVAVLLVKVRAGAPAVPVSPGEKVQGGGRASPSPPPAERTRPEEAPSPRPPEVPAAVSEPAADDPASLAEQMVEANTLYDRGDYEAAGRAAEQVLARESGNVKMLRIAASSACILGDAAQARVHYDKLPPSDQEQIARRCRRYGVEF